MQKRLFTFLFTACAVTTLLTLPAHATDVPAAAAGNIYLGADGAFASSIKRDPYNKDFRVTSETTTVGALRLFTGYQITPNIGLELGYVRRTDYRQSAVNGPLSYDATARTVNRDISLVYQFTEWLPGLFLTAGVVFSNLDITADTHFMGRTSQLRSTSSSRSSQLGIGYEAALVGDLKFRLGLGRYGDSKIGFVGLKYYFGR